MLETLETIANAEWMVDSCAQELAKQTLEALAAHSAAPSEGDTRYENLKFMAETLEAMLNEIQEICIDAKVGLNSVGEPCGKLVDAVRELATRAALSESQVKEIVEPYTNGFKFPDCFAIITDRLNALSQDKRNDC